MSISPRKLASGKTVYDVRLRTPKGRAYKRTFKTKDDAVKFHANELADRSRGQWIDPAAGQASLQQYTQTWMACRHDLRPRTRDLYDSLLRLHILPTLGDRPIAEITTNEVRLWHAHLIAGNPTRGTTAAKAYRLLHTIMATAVDDDEMIAKNPCRLKRAGQENSKERPVATIAQIALLADSIDRRYRAMVLLAAWTGMRYGELAGLTRADLDLLHKKVSITHQLSETNDGTRFTAPPKTAAGVRTIAIPPHLIPELENHLHGWAQPRLDGLVFPAPEGAPLRRNNFNRRFWKPALAKAGIHGLRFHDLRHTGNTLAAATGASVKELMARMGHASSRAALIYQHATTDRDEAIATALSAMAQTGATELPRTATNPDECAMDVP